MPQATNQVTDECYLTVEPIGLNLTIHLRDQEVAVVPASLEELSPDDRARGDRGFVRREFRAEGPARGWAPAFTVRAMLADGWTTLSEDEVYVDVFPGYQRPNVEVRVRPRNRFHEEAYVDNREGKAVKLSVGQWRSTIPAGYAGKWQLCRPLTEAAAQVQMDGRYVGTVWPLPRTRTQQEGAVVIDTTGRRNYVLTRYVDNGDPSDQLGAGEVRRFGQGSVHTLDLPISYFLEPSPDLPTRPHTMGRRSWLVLSEVK